MNTNQTSTRQRGRRSLAWLVTAGSLALILLAAAPASPAAGKKLVVTGHGYGHGVGMSQWGAYGFAKKGTKYRAIATHYYRGTKVGKVKRGKQIRVLLRSGGSSVEFSRSRRACGRDLKPSRTYRAVVSGGGVKLERSNGKRMARCGGTLAAKGNRGEINIGGEGKFRGDMVASATSSGMFVVNQLSLDNYVKGVIANEMIPSWPLAALQAQALAARSYALATQQDSGLFDVYDDTRSQVYGGVGSETRKTTRAVETTKREVITWKGRPIVAYFSSTSGGRTENVENVWVGGSKVPYLRSVRDPYDKASPYHRWRLTYTRSKATAALSGLVKGRLRRIEILKRGVSPRIIRAKVLGTGGTTRVSGEDLRARFGGRSTWLSFRWKR